MSDGKNKPDFGTCSNQAYFFVRFLLSHSVPLKESKLEAGRFLNQAYLPRSHAIRTASFRGLRSRAEQAVSFRNRAPLFWSFSGQNRRIVL